MNALSIKLFIISFTTDDTPGVHAKYLGINDAALKKGITSSIYDHQAEGKWGYFSLIFKLINAYHDLFWIRYNLEKSPFIFWYALILRVRKKN